ncbi:Nucleolar protein 9 [Pestalotiopsis sp. IQ-011]
MAGPGQQPERQQSHGQYESEIAAIFSSALAAFPVVQQWSSETIEGLKSVINARHAGAEWHEESAWTHMLINTILSSEDGWDWQRLKTCSNATYFTLPTHTISLLVATFQSHALDKARARVEAGDYAAPLDLFAGNASPRAGYPIFRLDYSSDEEFELYKVCWDRFLESRFYLPEAVYMEEVHWWWIDDKASLDGKGARQVQKVHEDLPSQFDMVRRETVSFVPYITAIDTHWTRVNEDGEVVAQAEEELQVINDGEYREYNGQFKCAVGSVFELWGNEQLLEPTRYFPRYGKIWGGNGVAFELPTEHQSTH